MSKHGVKLTAGLFPFVSLCMNYNEGGAMTHVPVLTMFRTTQTTRFLPLWTRSSTSWIFRT